MENLYSEYARENVKPLVTLKKEYQGFLCLFMSSLTRLIGFAVALVLLVFLFCLVDMPGGYR